MNQGLLLHISVQVSVRTREMGQNGEKQERRESKCALRSGDRENKADFVAPDVPDLIT